MTERGAVGKIQEWRGKQKGGERQEDEGMLALRGGTCCWKGRDYLGGRNSVGGTGK